MVAERGWIIHYEAGLQQKEGKLSELFEITY